MSALLVGSHIRGHASIRTRAVALVHVTLVTSNSFQYAIRFTRYFSCKLLLDYEIDNQKIIQ